MGKILMADFGDKSGNDPVYDNARTVSEGGFYGREPVIAKMSNGTLVCIFLTGGPTEPHNKNIIFYKKSYDGGLTWGDSQVLFSHPYRGVWGTEIFTDGKYPMMVVSMYNALCPFKELQTFISYTYDNGETWTEPSHADPSINTTSIRKGIVLSNGDFLFPVYWTIARNKFVWNEEGYYKDGWWDGTAHECGVAISSDKGESYTRFGRIKGETSLWEPACVEMENGHVVMYVRHDKSGYLGISESFDYGRSWSKYRLSDIPNSGAKITVLKVNDKIVLLGNFCADARTHLQMWISDDYGITWNKKIAVDDEDKFFTYPHAFADDACEKLYVAYENYREHYLKIYSFEELGL
ncbi:MAG: sialidase family protein [Bacillota bacterium]|nr:sialidase family protein [Bacillota bacterium]